MMFVNARITNWLLLVALISSTVAIAGPFDVIRTKTDAKFRGYWLDIEATKAEYNISTIQAVELQAQMRQALYDKTDTVDPSIQKRYVERAFNTALEFVRSQNYVPPIKVPVVKPGQFIVALDMDEMMIAHWSIDMDAKSIPIADERLTIKAQDVDFGRPGGTSPLGAKTPTRGIIRRLAEKDVLIRPGFREFVDRISAVPGFQGFVILTAKSNRAAVEIDARVRDRFPSYRENALGVLARDHLILTDSNAEIVKDLSVIEPTLKGVVLFDDSVGKPVQKELTIKVPAYGPKFHYENMNGCTSEKQLAAAQITTNILPFMADILVKAVGRYHREGGELSEQIAVDARLSQDKVAQKKFVGKLFDFINARINFQYFTTASVDLYNFTLQALYKTSRFNPQRFDSMRSSEKIPKPKQCSALGWWFKGVTGFFRF